MDFNKINSNLHRMEAFCRKCLRKPIDALKKHRFFTRGITACLVGSLAVGYTLFSSGFTIGLRVKYAGNIIATVKSADVFRSAKEIALEKIDSRADGEIIASPVFQPALTAPSQFDNADTVADAIIQNTDEIVEAFSIQVDGQAKICTLVDGLDEMLETAKTRFETEGAKNTSVFVRVPEVKTGYYVKSDLADFEEVQSFIYSLDVKTVSVYESEVEIPFQTKTVKTDSQYVGYSKTTEGATGLSLKTEQVILENGTETDRTVQEKQLRAPIDKVVTVGTAVPKTTSQQRVVMQKAGFVFPLGNASYKVSAYFGDGRNHKGIDLCAKAGTPIYAVADGTVVSSKYDGNYGNCVVVDHGNGIKTRYAHASVLRVAAGAQVKQGDLIALVGTTGQSTGNHLHFEVMINGNRVNPAPYIGL